MAKLLRILAYFRQDLWPILLSLLLIGASTLLGLLWVYPLAILIDLAAGKQQDQWLYRYFYDWTPKESALSQVLFLGGLMLAIRLGSELLRAWQMTLNIRIGLHGMMRVRCDLFRKLQQLSIGYHRSQPQGDAIYRVAWDTYGFQGMLNAMVALVVNLLTLVLMAAIALSISWKLTLLSLAIIPPMLGVMRLYGRVLQQSSADAKQHDSTLYTVIQRSMASIGLVQAFGRESDEYSHFDRTVKNSVMAYYRLHWHEVMYWACLGSVSAIGASVIFGYGGYQVSQGLLTIGSLAIFLDYVNKLYDPLFKLSSSGSGIITAMAGVKRVFEVLDLDPVIRDAPDAIDLSRQPRTLAMEQVGFCYASGSPVLEQLEAEIRPGEMVAFVGSSGVGKTTLLNLFPRFYDPSAGRLTLDGHDLRKIRLRSLRAHIALVLQDSVLLPTTIAENIAYGCPNATAAQIRRAAELAGAATFIEKLPEKYDSEVSEGGTNLSGGQRQRIAIARALLTEAPIIVMDEPTSALDAEHEQLITETLRDLKGQRTIIIVSHRLSTVADCDRIYLMEKGRIAEAGTHDELVIRRGGYYRLAKHQMKLGEA